MDADVRVTVDGAHHDLVVDTRTSLLDLVRHTIGQPSPKKGCDHGQCGACTALVDGRRSLLCLMLAVAHDGCEITTADGLAADDRLHPVQQAFLECDAYQCGYCTPGQICSAVGVLDEHALGWPSAVTDDLARPPELSREEIAERMSGNLCRCGAYVNIVEAVRRAGAEQRA